MYEGRESGAMKKFLALGFLYEWPCPTALWCQGPGPETEAAHL